jgi:23S rRNA (guanosine2251-2'-O)-methyltransferase
VPAAGRSRTAAPRTDLVYGRQPVREALRGCRRVREIVCTAEAAAALPWLEVPGVRRSIAVEDAVTALAERPDHQGVVALCDPYPYADAAAILGGTDTLAVVLDGVTDPRNLGAIARVCEVLGADGLIVPRHGSAGVTAVVARASAGAVEHLPIAMVTNVAETLRRARRPDLWSYAAEAEGGSPPWGLDFRGGTVLVLGSEGAGLRPLVRRRCDAAVSIPQIGQVQSLNVAVAAGMLLYEARRQRSTTA